ncbi:MAG: hypothetical protein PHV74_10490 [Dehalococcoidia bacterium]|nr:hypothetical protein [Dehalococcoidia bacterium]
MTPSAQLLEGVIGSIMGKDTFHTIQAMMAHYGLKNRLDTIHGGVRDVSLRRFTLYDAVEMKKENTEVLPIVTFGGPLWTDSELLFERKQFIPALQQLLVTHSRPIRVLKKSYEKQS